MYILYTLRVDFMLRILNVRLYNLNIKKFRYDFSRIFFCKIVAGGRVIVNGFRAAMKVKLMGHYLRYRYRDREWDRFVNDLLDW